jgi:hypothetical protein
MTNARRMISGPPPIVTCPAVPAAVTARDLSFGEAIRTSARPRHARDHHSRVGILAPHDGRARIDAQDTQPPARQLEGAGRICRLGAPGHHCGRPPHLPNAARPWPGQCNSWSRFSLLRVGRSWPGQSSSWSRFSRPRIGRSWLRGGCSGGWPWPRTRHITHALVVASLLDRRVPRERTPEIPGGQLAQPRIQVFQHRTSRLIWTA